MTKNCEMCGREFKTKPSQVAKGHGRFCSKGCHDRNQRAIALSDIWNKINRNGPMPADPSLGPCWLWTGHICKRRGYGRITFMGKGNNAHRIVYKLFHSIELQPEIFVCHKCDNPSCVNPHHMFLGTTDDNMWDCAAKSRKNHGTDRYNHKLTPEAVIEIRQERLRGVSYTELSKRFNVSRAAVWSAEKGVTWARVLPQEMLSG